jgi:hypothetical protein
MKEMSNIVIAYDRKTAYSAGIMVTPEEDLKAMGVNVSKWESVDVMKIVFLRINKLPNPLPSYTHVCSSDFSFSDEP